MSWFRAGETDGQQVPADDAAGHLGTASGIDRPIGPGMRTGAGVPTNCGSEGDRRLLIDLVIYAFDRARTPAIQDRLTAGLAQVGVQVLRPDGGPFDPATQEAGGVLPTADPAMHNVVAETESAGFRDGERIVREPVVVVYRFAARS